MNTHTQHNNLLPVSRIAWPAYLAVALLAGCGGGGGGSNNNADSPIAAATTSNTAPTAFPSALSTTADTPSYGMLNASDADGDPLTYSIVTSGSMGTAVITNPATGAYTYTPNQGDYGTDIFTLKASDGKADSNIAAVTVTISQVNSAPVAIGGCGTIPQAETFFGTLSATDPDSNLLMFRLNADGSGGTGPIITAMGGTITILNPTLGTFRYDPGMSPGAKRRGKDTFDFQVQDPDGLSSNATEAVIINQTIMPLGDSITKGSGPEPDLSLRVGYRKPLFDMLTSSGFTFDFVGSLVEGWAVPGFDPDHEGHGGWSAKDIAMGIEGGYPIDGVRAWLERSPTDIVLLHAGTNGLSASNVVDIESILDEIKGWGASAWGNPVTVILALIIDQALGPDPTNPEVTAFNNAVLTMANVRIDNGEDIIVVNQHDALNYPADMFDDKHPNDSGYAKMAPVWFNALASVLDKCP